MGEKNRNIYPADLTCQIQDLQSKTNGKIRAENKSHPPLEYKCSLIQRFRFTAVIYVHKCKVKFIQKMRTEQVSAETERNHKN